MAEICIITLIALLGVSLLPCGSLNIFGADEERRTLGLFGGTLWSLPAKVAYGRENRRRPV